MEKDTTKLLPCPFCGEKLTERDYYHDREEWYITHSCFNGMESTTCSYEYKECAEEAWNARADTGKECAIEIAAQYGAEIASLREDLDAKSVALTKAIEDLTSAEAENEALKADAQSLASKVHGSLVADMQNLTVENESLREDLADARKHAGDFGADCVRLEAERDRLRALIVDIGEELTGPNDAATSCIIIAGMIDALGAR